MPKRQIPPVLRRRVRERAAGRCEYCLIHDEDAFFSHEADHVNAEKHGGATTDDNLAWAFATCNRYKGTDLTSFDPATRRLAPLYNPRMQRWSRHFRLRGAYIEPVTASGRATAHLLRFNDRVRLDEREALIAVGRYPRS